MTSLTWSADAGARTSEAPPRILGTIWTLLLINAIGYSSVTTVVPFPHAVAQIVTMGSLAVAFVLALVANRDLAIRPSALLLLLSLLVVSSLAASLQMESGIGAFVRCARFSVFVATIWLLTRWWRGDFRFAVYHVRVMAGFLVTVVLGMVLSPAAAFSGPDGRLVGAVWPITAPQVGLYCAVATGLTSILWLAGHVSGRSALAIAAPALGLLLLSHTRTALLGLVVALAVAGLSMVTTGRRVRKALAVAVAVAGVGWLVLWQVIYAFLLRGQDRSQLTSLTGRAKVWHMLLTANRTPTEELIGVGLTDKSFNGLPIDSSWMTIYNEEGLVGLTLVVSFLLVLIIVATLRPPSAQRASAIFLVVYGLVASYTEVGLSDASPYLLNLAVAASLLAVSDRHRVMSQVTSAQTASSPLVSRLRARLDPATSPRERVSAS